MPSVEDLIAGPLEAHGVLIAGPGAGKSFRIGERIGWLLSHGIDDPGDILLITLTNETARTLRSRFPVVPVRTVHSYALARLNELGDAVRKRVADEWETLHLVGRDIQRIAGNAGVKVRVDTIPRFLRDLGTGFLTEPDAEPELTDEQRALYVAWQRVREFLSLRLFSEFAPDLVGLLREGGDIANPPRSILVDEYQDLTPIELRLIRVLAQKYDAGVFACGDDRQSIYGFRGADPTALSRFPTTYGTDGPAFLTLSRRCPASVLVLAEAVARRMPAVEGFSSRPPMESDPDLGAGEVRVARFKSVESEARWVIRQMAGRFETAPDESIAVIVPRDTDVYLNELRQAAEREGVSLSFEDSRSQLALGEELGFRAAYAVLRLAADPDDELAWRTLLRTGHGIGPEKLEAIYSSGASRLSVALRRLAETDGLLRRFIDAVTEGSQAVFSADTADEAMAAVDRTADAISAPRIDWAALLSVVARGDRAALDETAAEEEAGDEPWRDLLKRCRATVYEEAADQPYEPGRILVYTVWAAKGQQWRHVFLMGTYAQGFLDQHHTGEGLRRLYVALTRSLWSLTVTRPNWVRYTTIGNRLGTSTVQFPQQLAEACHEVGLTIEEDPDD